MPSENRSLTEEEGLKLQQILHKIYNPNDFDVMLRDRAKRKRTDLSPDDIFPNVISNVIEKFEQQEEMPRFLKAASDARPNNLFLRELAQTFGVTFHTEASPSPPLEEILQRRVSELHSSFNALDWMERFSILQRQICRIVVTSGRKASYGTGFLLGPSVVMTNYHVLKEVLDEDLPSENVEFHFDYRSKGDDKISEKVKTYYLAEDWLIDTSQGSPSDGKVTDQFVDVEPGHLDYALLRLKGKPGTEFIKPGVMRGWIELQGKDGDFVKDSPLLILHYPYGDPLEIANNTQAIVGINNNKTRIRYSTYTQSGSSGAPCFNENWELIAIHQSGDPDAYRSARYNQGIPIQTILHRLKKRGKSAFLGEKASDPPLSEPISMLSTQPDTHQVQFSLPEEKMPEAIKLLLITLLEKNILTDSAYESQTNDKAKEPIYVSEEMLEHGAEKMTSEQTHFLTSGYVQTVRENVEQTRQLFDVQGDIRLIQFIQAQEMLEMSETCLQKMCAIFNHALHLPDQKRLQACLDATSIVKESEQLRQVIKIMQEKNQNDHKQREEIKDKCTGLLKSLKELTQVMEEK
jgi:V8-like Glu-specific endopeptidase